MDIHNYMEDIVEGILDDVLVSNPEEEFSHAKSKLDVAALALNNLPPKYVVTQKGRIYAKLAELGLQLKADVLREVTKAMGVVRKNPQR